MCSVKLRDNASEWASISLTNRIPNIFLTPILRDACRCGSDARGRFSSIYRITIYNTSGNRETTVHVPAGAIQGASQVALVRGGWTIAVGRRRRAGLGPVSSHGDEVSASAGVTDEPIDCLPEASRGDGGQGSWHFENIAVITLHLHDRAKVVSLRNPPVPYQTTRQSKLGAKRIK